MANIAQTAPHCAMAARGAKIVQIFVRGAMRPARTAVRSVKNAVCACIAV